MKFQFFVVTPVVMITTVEEDCVEDAIETVADRGIAELCFSCRRPQPGEWYQGDCNAHPAADGELTALLVDGEPVSAEEFARVAGIWR